MSSKIFTDYYNPLERLAGIACMSTSKPIFRVV